MPRRKQPAIPDELLDQLLGGSDPRTALADGGLLDGLKKALAERALNAELDHHLETGEPDGRTNGRNGYSAKGVFTGTGKLDLQIPRDRLSTFDPQLIAKYQRRFPGFDDKIVSMYARGMSTREIQGHLRELYGIEVSPDLVSAVTDAVLDEVANGRTDPSKPSTRWSSSMPSASKCATRARSATRRSMSRSASGRTAPRKCSGSGSSRPRAPSSGCGS
jgi:putative transposase